MINLNHPSTLRYATRFFVFSAFCFLLLIPRMANSAQVLDIKILDKDIIVVRISDGSVTHTESGSDQDDIVNRFTPELNISEAIDTGNWTITSNDDGNYAGGVNPNFVYRKTTLSGHAQTGWNSSINDYNYEVTLQHYLYLRLPNSLVQGSNYTVTIDSSTNAPDQRSITFDIFSSVSPAIHTNLVGYLADSPGKAADLYHWMGDGAARDYSSFEGNTVYIYDVNNQTSIAVGTVVYWQDDGTDVYHYNMLHSTVWNIDFDAFSTPGTYRLVVEGVGCSEDFVIGNNAYRAPFEVSLRGYYYMRIGHEDSSITPPTRTPLFIPGTDTIVYLTSMHPYHQDWESFAGGDKWDRTTEWAAYMLPGNPTNDSAWGGYSDAADWDRHLGHIPSIYDLLLPVILSQGALNDDNTGISESGNGIPDVIDSAAWEVDFWLRLRDSQGGYSHGLNNPMEDNGQYILYQAGATTVAAWANAANCAMLAEALRLVGNQQSLSDYYTTEAISAYNHALSQTDQMLDNSSGGAGTGRDLKMMAAAYLYNLTGNTDYEDVINEESVINSTNDTLLTGETNQIWGSVAYLFTPQTVNYPDLQNGIHQAFIDQASETEANYTLSRPSRRAATNQDYVLYFHTIQNVHLSLVAHAITDDAGEKEFFLRALTLEADWGLGRNPLNQIQMTTQSTVLQEKNSPFYIYTSGNADGYPGSHPGHTPYMNLDDWNYMGMGSPSDMAAHCYPAFSGNWPIAEGYFDTPWVWAHSEFTPQQTMRGKMALYGYLHSLSQSAGPSDPTLTVYSAGSGSGIVTSSPAGIECGQTCSAAFTTGTEITLSAQSDTDNIFTGWSGACSGTETCILTLNAPTYLTATFEKICDTDEDCEDNDQCTIDNCNLDTNTCVNTAIPYCGGDCSNGNQRACYSGPAETAGIGVCSAGIQTCENSQWGPCTQEVLPSEEVCGDQLDNDCNGIVDNGCGNDDSGCSCRTHGTRESKAPAFFLLFTLLSIIILRKTLIS
ncbi:glycosyl hydrolase family 5 [Myxococcota bacterium]|nr:glycosyl hydrolase family 5 [Myxococcota bacterium]MBU1383065.1 glycosyl hydrolase family 5 [Myxococcota bacterium]MBU1498238.1 glycosyl hydrolase family 5 [Myxococcota bacterium]